MEKELKEIKHILDTLRIGLENGTLTMSVTVVNSLEKINTLTSTLLAELEAKAVCTAPDKALGLAQEVFDRQERILLKEDLNEWLQANMLKHIAAYHADDGQGEDVDPLDGLEDCPRCSGKGFVERGFTTRYDTLPRVPCHICCGTGKDGGCAVVNEKEKEADVDKEE